MTDRAGERVLIIDDGAPAALVATLLQPAPALVTLWHDSAGPAPARRLEASTRRVAALALAGLELAPVHPAETDDRVAGLDGARALLEAAACAVRLGCARIVWPVVLGGDLAGMAGAADRVRAVERLIDLETNADTAPIRFDLPLLDLTLHQVADLAIDLDAPADGAWWCEHEGGAPCAACPSCESWQRALHRARFGLAGVHEGAGAP